MSAREPRRRNILRKEPPRSYISYCLHAAEALIDSLQFLKYCRLNRKVAYRLRKALGFIRRAQVYYPQENYSLHRWLTGRETNSAKLQRSNWGKYRRLKAIEAMPKLESFLDTEK